VVQAARGAGLGHAALPYRYRASRSPPPPPPHTHTHTYVSPPLLQGVGAPCCARILTSWFAAKERGTYWGMWNIAHNMGGFLAPILAGTAAKVRRQPAGAWGSPAAIAADGVGSQRRRR
jgi:MFS family permease